MSEDRVRALADLSVRVGANVGEGQYVMVVGLVEHVPLVRAIADVAYGIGARYVDAAYADQHVRRSMIERKVPAPGPANAGKMMSTRMGVSRMPPTTTKASGR